MKKYKLYIISALILLIIFITFCFIPIDATRFIPSVENQVAKDYGIKIHIEKLILRLGPSLKVKAPVMHMLYEDGQKFGQFDNVKFFIPWSSFFKNEINIKRICANNLIIKVNSGDKYLQELLNKLLKKDFDKNPDINLKKYSFTYRDTDNNKIYKTEGNLLSLYKLKTVKNFKLSTTGLFYIDDKQYLSYDLSILPNLDMPEKFGNNPELYNIINQIETFDFHSDIIADLKIYNNAENEQQISGLINIDNISVLDKNKKTPKSFIYLTFFGNKTGILSNIYSSGENKVCVEGTINHSKKPEIDLKVKTDKIELENLYDKIKLFANLSNFKGIEDIRGKLYADFTLKGDLKKIKSSGFMKIADASIKANGIDVNKITSDIDFSNNNVTITNAVGYVNSAPISMKGKIGNSIDLELLMDKVELKRILPKSSGIENGILSLIANISGTFDNITHKENLKVDNFKLTKNKDSISIANLILDTNKENTAFINNVVIKTEKLDTIKLPSAKINIINDSVAIPDTNIFMTNSKLKMNADFSGYTTGKYNFNVNIDGYINSKDLKILKDINSATYPVKFNATGDKNEQTIESQILLEKAMLLDEPAIVNISSKYENNSLKIEDFSISSFSGQFSNNFKSNIKGTKKITVTGILENLENPAFKNLRIFIPQQLNISFKDTIAQLKGDIFINGCINNPEIVGQISAQNIINQFMQLSINNLSVDFNKNIALINVPTIKLGDSAMTVNASILTDISKAIQIKNINIKSKYLNTDTILMYKDYPLLTKIPLEINDGKFYAENTGLTIYNSPLSMTALSADFKLKDNILNADNISSEMHNGKIAGNLTFNLKDDGFKTNIQARGVSAAPIFDAAVVKKDSISGTMDFDANLAGNILNRESLNGNIKFIVHNGRMGSLGKLEHLIYAQNVIADNMLRTSLSVVTRALTLKDTGLFKYLKGDITMKDGIANINMLQSQGPQMALFIKGQYNPSTDYAKLTVLGRVSDEIISGLGAFGDFSLNKLMIMLTGNENRYNIKAEDIEKLPQLPIRNTKEFRSIISGILEKPSSVLQFNWISYTQKSLRQKEVPQTNTKIPDFIESLPY